MFMKKVIVLLFVTLVLSLCAFALPEQGIFLSQDLGDVQIVYTRREAIPSPHGIVYTSEDFGVIDVDGNFIVQPIYGRISAPKEGRARFYLNGKYGYFDENWNVVIQPSYRGAEDFSEGLALVTDDNWAYGFIDKDGNTVLPHTFDYAESFKDGLATIGKVDEGYSGHTFIRTGKFDKEGRQVEPIMYRWEDSYEVQMSLNNVRLNGHTYENEKLAYPFINYLGYTYIPLTYYGMQETGIKSEWSQKQGLVLTTHRSSEISPSNDGKPLDKLYGSNTMKKGEMFKAKVYDGALTINGETYFSYDVYYPILTCNDIVYIPVLWKQGMEGLGLKYSYDLEAKSLVIDVVS